VLPSADDEKAVKAPEVIFCPACYTEEREIYVTRLKGRCRACGVRLAYKGEYILPQDFDTGWVYSRKLHMWKKVRELIGG